MITVTTKVRFSTSRAGRKRLTIGAAAGSAPEVRVPRISKLMALAVRFDGLLRSGVVADMSELARLARVTQPRMTQIMNLNHLAPDIQEALLTLPPFVRRHQMIHERSLRPICAESNWGSQRRLWLTLVARGG